MLGKKKLVQILSREMGVPLKMKDVYYQKNYYGAPEMATVDFWKVRTVPGSGIILLTDDQFCTRQVVGV